ncbi:MAG: NYN domain-containing protein [Gammaproteobacteria bacterium]|nr:NYN domain-containing protein [Gammaproteobacteria bacterium]
MPNDSDDLSLALFCDFENVALGVRDTKYPKFNIQLVLERLLLKGSIVVKKAYCDWDRYKEFKPVMHDASFELIEIPHTRQSGKNSADIRMVVDALDLCYTKEHIDTFVIISGDSDFSPLVSKLRENARIVIGVGVKNSTSDLLMNSCDEFIFYDDLVRDDQSSRSRKQKPAPKEAPAKAAKSKRSATPKPEENRIDDAISLILETAEALYADQGDRQKLWGSMVKQTIKRRRPGFNERFYGVRSFGELLEAAENRGLLKLELDERSGGYVIKELTADK